MAADKSKHKCTNVIIPLISDAVARRYYMYAVSLWMCSYINVQGSIYKYSFELFNSCNLIYAHEYSHTHRLPTLPDFVYYNLYIT